MGMVMNLREGSHFPLLRSPLSSITSVNRRAQMRLTDTVPSSVLDHHNDAPILGGMYWPCDAFGLGSN